MRFIPSYNICTLFVAVAFIHAVSTIAAAAAPPPVGPDEGNARSSSKNDMNLVSVMLNSHEPIDLYVPTNGDLAYADLNRRTDVDYAIVLNNIKAKCFFYRSNLPNWTYDDNDGDIFATTVFTAHGSPQMGITFEGANRVYCYDTSRARKDAFTLFVEPDDEQVRVAGQHNPELLRVRISKDDDFVEKPLRISASLKAQLGDRKSVRVKLVDWPVRGGSNFVPIDEHLWNVYNEKESDPGCYFLLTGQTALVQYMGVYTLATASLQPINAYDRVVCFRDHTSQRIKQNWLQTQSQGQQG